MTGRVVKVLGDIVDAPPQPTIELDHPQAVALEHLREAGGVQVHDIALCGKGTATQERCSGNG